MQANQIPPLPGSYTGDKVAWSIFVTWVATFVYWAKGRRRSVTQRKRQEAGTEGRTWDTAAHEESPRSLMGF